MLYITEDGICTFIRGKKFGRIIRIIRITRMSRKTKFTSYQIIGVVRAMVILK
jgi:hypothetical protein